MTAKEAARASRPQTSNGGVFEQLEAYPWDTDPEFQSGLQAILSQSPSPDQAQQLTLRARCFYFARKNDILVDFNAYQTWRADQRTSSLPNCASSAAPISNATALNDIPADSAQVARQEPNAATASSEPPAPYPPSFSQIVELITNGQPIPGVKEVPNVVLEGQASQPTTAKRKKPWEQDDGETEEEKVGTAINA